MVTVITEKLRNQSLEDVKVETVPALQTARNSWTFTTSSPSAFQLTGSKGWTMFLDPKSHWPKEPAPGTTAQTPAFSAGMPTQGSTISGQQDLLSQPQTAIMVPSCPSNDKFIESCAEMEAIPNTPPPPPMKRHCRSLSLPTDRKEPCKWQPQASQIWRPVPSRSPNTKLKNRNSPHSGPHRPMASRASPQQRTQVQGCLLPTSGASSGIWPISKSEDFSTPPESPVPRPASASSGRLASEPHLNWSGGLNRQVKSSGGGGGGGDLNPNKSSIQGNNNNNTVKLDAFRLRSLSMEEPLSQLIRAGFTRDTCSMPVIPGSGSHHSTPSSPRRQRVLRCRSQPCVLHDRKCLKRRRDEERPALDFHKMTETAYDRGGWRLSGRHLPHHIRSSRSLASLFSEPPECVLGLNTIASSPLDGVTVPSSLGSSKGEVDYCERSGQGAQNMEPAEGEDKKMVRGKDGDTQGDNKENSTKDFIDSEDGCSCDAEEECKKGDGEVFELEMNDLDLDQIEND